MSGPVALRRIDITSTTSPLHNMLSLTRTPGPEQRHESIEHRLAQRLVAVLKDQVERPGHLVQYCIASPTMTEI